MGIAVALLALMAVGLAIFMSYSQTTADKQDIRDYLERKGASNIIVHWDWPISSRNNHFYTIEYTDSRGVRCKTECVGTGGKIHWSEPPEA